MRDLKSQIAAYAEHLDAVAPDLADLDLRRPTAGVRPRSTPHTRQRLALAAAGAAVVVIVAVGVAGLAFRSGSAPVADTTPQIATTSTAPGVAAQVPGGMGLVSESPVLTGPDAFTGPGGIVHGPDGFHMFFTNHGEDGAVIGHATSDDLVAWSIADGEIFSSADVDFLAGMIQARTAVVLPDGSWAVYFDGFEPGPTEREEGANAIGVATAPGPDGPWTVHPQPVLSVPDVEGLDAKGVGQPTVVASGDGLVMFYVLRDSEFMGRIGRATSADGFTWEQDDGVVIEADREWERGSVTLPNVVIDGDRWVMMYAARTPSGHGFAVSPDGVAWEKASSAPVVTINDVLRASIKDTELVLGSDGDLYLAVENGGSRTSTEVYMLREDS